MNAAVKNGDVLSPAEAAIRAGRSEATILRWVREGRLPAIRDRIRRTLRIQAADLDALLGDPVPAATPPAATASTPPAATPAKRSRTDW